MDLPISHFIYINQKQARHEACSPKREFEWHIYIISQLLQNEYILFATWHKIMFQIMFEKWKMDQTLYGSQKQCIRPYIEPRQCFKGLKVKLNLLSATLCSMWHQWQDAIQNIFIEFILYLKKESALT